MKYIVGDKFKINMIDYNSVIQQDDIIEITECHPETSQQYAHYKIIVNDNDRSSTILARILDEANVTFSYNDINDINYMIFNINDNINKLKSLL